MFTKEEARHFAKDIRKAMSEKAIKQSSSRICTKLCMLDEYKKSDCILVYMARGSEVDLKDFINDAWKSGKIVAFPRVLSKTEMEFYIVNCFHELEAGTMGIKEPKVDLMSAKGIYTNTKTLMIMPGLAFDIEGHRVGYGGGYYDRFIANLPEGVDVYKVAVSYQTTVFDKILAEEQDVDYDKLITDGDDLKL